jgi:peptide-methionine (S)-S-oxide reductase
MMPDLPALSVIALGGGCHWCTEAVFQSLRGVGRVEQGWVASEGAQSEFSEAVIVHFDPARIPLEALIHIHLRTHSSTSRHSMRGKYRSAVYAFSEKQAAEARLLLAQLQAEFSAPLVTEVLPFRAFRPSRAEIRDYYYQNPARPFCEAWIAPKLRLLLAEFGEYADRDRIAAGAAPNPPAPACVEQP